MYGGKKLRQLRQLLDLNQDEFAVELGISQPYYSAIESGKKKLTNKLLEQIKIKWNVDRSYFENPNISATEYLIDKRGDKLGGMLGVRQEIRALGVSFDKNFLYKATLDLAISHPELSKLHYDISDLSALLADIENIFSNYLDYFSLNEGIKAASYSDYKQKLINQLREYEKYEAAISPLVAALRKFILQFMEYDTKRVIDHDRSELQ